MHIDICRISIYTYVCIQNYKNLNKMQFKILLLLLEVDFIVTKTSIVSFTTSKNFSTRPIKVLKISDICSFAQILWSWSNRELFSTPEVVKVVLRSFCVFIQMISILLLCFHFYSKIIVFIFCNLVLLRKTLIVLKRLNECFFYN